MCALLASISKTFNALTNTYGNCVNGLLAIHTKMHIKPLPEPSKFSSNTQEGTYRGCTDVTGWIPDIEDASSASRPERKETLQFLEVITGG